VSSSVSHSPLRSNNNLLEGFTGLFEEQQLGGRQNDLDGERRLRADRELS